MSSFCPTQPKPWPHRVVRRAPPAASRARFDVDALIGVACVVILVAAVASLW